ncbi:hypothetical protein BpHYR1_027918 [Brachionus plicatilis]|uniref:Uncharacterized protein n=1 Tax=Brachionus plicatilis TaxID=10195 RepID=A0A3M7T8D1_BRAPC|nr:hypothetical protein BpHYR1_027918 [Brachionus plicatilis]
MLVLTLIYYFMQNFLLKFLGSFKKKLWDLVNSILFLFEYLKMLSTFKETFSNQKKGKKIYSFFLAEFSVIRHVSAFFQHSSSNIS